MATGTSSKPSFSRARKWGIGFNVALASLVVLAVAAMVNYLSGNYFQRFYLSTRTRVELSPRTINLLHSLTNRIQITLYYDKDEPLYSDIIELLKEYHSNNPKLTIATVDWYRDPGAVPEFKAKYNLGSSTNKNLVVFDCEGRTKILDGNMLAQYRYNLEQATNQTELRFNRKQVAFKGEMMFTAALLAVTNPKPFQACFLQGHGEPRLDDTGDAGYAEFVGALRQNYIAVAPLSLVGSNAVPLDCNLLIIAGPTDPVPQIELDQIDHYLNEGGRLFVLLNVSSARRQTGLEKMLTKWGVHVGSDVVKDPENTTGGSDVVVSAFADHPAVNPLTGRRLRMILPREISRTDSYSQAPEGVRIQEIARSGPRSYLQNGDTAQKPQPRSLMVAVEKEALKGVIPQRGTTRMLVVGDSLFLDNQLMDLDYDSPNRDFASYAANWLLDRTLLLEGLGPRPVSEYRLLMTRSQLQALQWILLAAMPGGVLLFGGMVWLRRRS